MAEKSMTAQKSTQHHANVLKINSSEKEESEMTYST